MFRDDLRHGIRMLSRAPVFTIIAIGALAIGVGANIVVFGFANALLLRPLHVADPARLIRAYSNPSDPISTIDYGDYQQFRDRNESLSSLALFHWGGLRPVRLSSGAALEMIHVMPVSGNYFSTLGIRAVMGRTIGERDDQPGAPDVAVIRDVCWRHHFDADPSVIGRTVMISKRTVAVIGVLPASFQGAIGFPIVPQFYVAWNGLGRQPFTGRGQLIGRLKDGVSRAAAQADLSRVAAQLAAEKNEPVNISVVPANALVPTMRGTAAWFAVAFMIVVGVVLLIACDDIALLLIARSAARRREIGIRAALGASRARLVGQFLTESLLLAIAGGAGAIAVAEVTARMLTRIYLPVPMPIALTFEFDWRVVAFAVVVSLGTTALFGVGPALQAARTDIVSSLKAVGTQGSGGAKARSQLVITQAALSTALLVTAVVMVHSLISGERMDKGFQSEHVLMGTFQLAPDDYNAARGVTFCNQLLDNVQRIPGVLAANVMDNIPVANSRPATPVRLTGTHLTGTSEPVSSFAISPGHFATLQIPLKSGRDFRREDGARSTPVGIVNETLAHRYWPGESAIGKQLRTTDGKLIEVVGVAHDSKYEGPDEGPKPFLYRPFAQQYFPTITLLVRTAGDPKSMSQSVRNAISELDPNVVAYGVAPLDERLELGLLPNRVAAWVAALLGLGALMLGAVGTYGIVSLLVQQRRREMGIRIALGALPSDVFRLVVGQGVGAAAIGVAIGLAMGFIATQLLRRLFFGLSARDPIAFVSVTVLLCSTAVLACSAPAWRASRTDPLAALREE